MESLINKETKTCLELLSKNKCKEAYKILSKLEVVSDTEKINFNGVKYKEEFIQIMIQLIPVENINGIERDRINLLILMLTIFGDFSDSSNEFRKYLCDHVCFIEKISEFIKMLLNNKKLMSINNQMLELSTLITYNLSSNNTGTKMSFRFNFDINDKNINVQTKIALCGTNIYNQYLNGKYKLFLKNVLSDKKINYAPFTEKEINKCLNKCEKEDVELKNGRYKSKTEDIKKIEKEYNGIERRQIKDARVSNSLHIY